MQVRVRNQRGLAAIVSGRVVSPAKLEGLAHKRIEAWRRVGAHALLVADSIDLALALEASSGALRRRPQLLG